MLAQKQAGQFVIRLEEIRADSKDTAVDARLRFAVKKRPVVEPFVDEPLGDTADHHLCRLAGWVEAKIHKCDNRVEGCEVFLRPTPITRRSLEGEEFRPPTFRCDARAFRRNHLRSFTGEVLHDLPADGGIGIEEPFKMRRPRCVIVRSHELFIADDRRFYLRALKLPWLHREENRKEPIREDANKGPISFAQLRFRRSCRECFRILAFGLLSPDQPGNFSGPV